MKLRSERVRIAFLTLAPVALLISLWLLPKVDPNGRLGFAYDRDGFIELARRQAEVMERPVDGWVAGVDVDSNDAIDRYLRYRQRQEPAAVAAVRRVAPPAAIEVRFSSPRDEPTVRVLLAPNGTFLGGSIEADHEGTAVDEEGPLEERIQSFLREWLGEDLAARAAPVDDVPSSEEEDAALPPKPPTAPLLEDSPDPISETRTWTLVLAQLPELTLTPEITLRDGRFTGWEIASRLDVEAVGASVERGSGSLALRAIAGVLLFLVAAAMVPRGLWRYWLRFQEAEVSHARTVLLGLLVAGLAAASLIFLLLGSEASQVRDELFAGSGTIGVVLAGLVVAGMTMPVGLVLGAAWAGAEGDVREIFPAKLVSLDAVLAGRLLSRNPSRAFLHGAAMACWVCLAHTLMLSLWIARPEAGPDLAPDRLLVSHPWHFTIAISLLLLIPFGSLGFLGLLSLLRQWTRSRWLTVPPVTIVLWLACLLLPWVTRQVPMTAGLLLAAVWAAAFIVPFYLFDLLTAFLCFVQASLFLQVLVFLVQPSAALAAAAAVPITILALCLLAAGLILRFGRDVAGREVRPGYARNMLERAALSAELSAALQARAKLLPEREPELPGAAFTVSAAAEDEAEGEYYDFFPLDDGRVAFALADFGHQGLAAALRMTLAKGHLMSYCRRNVPPGVAVARLERRLDELVADPGGLGLVYGVFDPATGRLELAGGRGAPWVLVHQGGRELLELPPGGPVGEAAADVTWEEGLTLEQGDAAAFLALRDQPSPEGRKRFLRAVAARKEPFTAEDLRNMLRTKGLPSGTVMVLAVSGENS